MTVLAAARSLTEDVCALLSDRVPAAVLDRVLLELDEAQRDGGDDDLRELLETGVVRGALRSRRVSGWHLVGVRSVDSARLLSRARLHAEAYREDLFACRLRDTLWLLLPDASLGWAAQLREPAVVGDMLAVGKHVADLRMVPAHRASLDELLTVGQRRGWSGFADTARLEVAVRVEALLDLAARQPALLEGTLDVLFEIPANRVYAQTLLVWFEQDRDTVATAARLHLHVNTVRYRLRRAQEIAEVDLSDWDQRLLAEVQLRMWQSSQDSEA